MHKDSSNHTALRPQILSGGGGDGSGVSFQALHHTISLGSCIRIGLGLY